jgi:hypothetical protein
MKLENGMLVISIDVDVGNRELGVINRGENDANVNLYISEYRIGKIEETALPLFVETFNDFEVPVTFAIRGQLIEVNDSIPELLLKSSVKHDIGAHGYYHREFTNLSRNEAENELNMISANMEKFGIDPRSFVFPRNKVAHLDLLERHGYKCYRGYGDFMNDRMHIERKGQLINIHPSLHLDDGTSFVFLKKILDISVARKLPFHVWFHLWDFGETKEAMRKSIKKVFLPFFSYARRKERSDALRFETMLSAALKVERNLKIDARAPEDLR